MRTQLLQNSNSAILECVGPVANLNDAMAIVAATYELNTSKVLLRDSQLPAEFFELQTGFAGEFIQKLVNYRIAVACVFGSDMPLSERFREYIGEAKRGRQFRSFIEVGDAIAWLDGQ